jgi:hypothetical protein
MRRIVAGAAHAPILYVQEGGVAAHAPILYVQEGGVAAHAPILYVHAGALWGLWR